MLGECAADMIRRLAEWRHGEPERITRQWTKRPYLTRWTVARKWDTVATVPPGGHAEIQNRSVYLHHFQDSDADEMHDHPWPFVSVILSGGYWERTPAAGWADGRGPTRERWYGPGRVLVRPANWIHSVRLPGPADKPRPCWTLLYVGRKLRPWGFWCPVGGWIPWRRHLANYYRSGHGCPE
jgi:hypothetical protein